MMKLAPMAVWTSSLVDAQDLKKAVNADVEFIHTNDLVKLICYIYTASMNYLLNNPTDPDRARKAYDLAAQITENELTADLQNDSQSQNCLVCLLMAQQLSDEADNDNKQSQREKDDEEFLARHYDCTE